MIVINTSVPLNFVVGLHFRAEPVYTAAARAVHAIHRMHPGFGSGYTAHHPRAEQCRWRIGSCMNDSE